MLFQITNTCYEECPHCMDCSKPNEPHASLELLPYVANFYHFIGAPILVISGGEPTTHPDFEEICLRFSLNGIPFSICSNGTWVFDQEKRKVFEHVVRLPFFAGAQIYSDKRFYRSYEKVKEHKEYFDEINERIETWLDEEQNEAARDEYELTDQDDADQLAEFYNRWMSHDYSTAYPVEVKEEHFISKETGAFLTKRACKEYIERFGYNHSNPHTYAMTAYRNFEYARLLNILKTMEFAILDNHWNQ